MASNLTALDNALIGGMLFKFRSEKMLSGDLKYGTKIEFQFPPRFLSDNRKGEWVEGPLRGDEPVAVYAVSGAREITMTWTYIAGARGGESNSLFTPSKIATQIQNLRSYFSNPYKSMSLDSALTVYFHMWRHTGFNQFSCRLKSVDVTYGKALVTNPEGPHPQPEFPTFADAIHQTYALRTDVTVEMRLWTKVGSSGEVKNKATAQSHAGDEQEKLELPNLDSVVPIDWQ